MLGLGLGLGLGISIIRHVGRLERLLSVAAVRWYSSGKAHGSKVNAR